MLELGTGCDALHLPGRGFKVHATDFSASGLNQLRDAAPVAGLTGRITTTVMSRA